MARRQVGSVMKKSEDKLKFVGPNGKPLPEFYIKITEDVNLKKGDFVNLENKALKLASLEANKDRMSAETYESALERINKMPDFVQFELIRNTRD